MPLYRIGTGDQMLESDEELRTLLTESKTIAVIGASPKPWRDSGEIAAFLMRKGYTVYPVNPKYDEILGVTSYPNLKSIPDKIDLVDIFRNPADVMPVIDEAIAVGAKAVWMQLGVVNEEAAQKADDAGLKVVMDRCIAVEHRALL